MIALPRTRRFPAGYWQILLLTNNNLNADRSDVVRLQGYLVKLIIASAWLFSLAAVSLAQEITRSPNTCVVKEGLKPAIFISYAAATGPDDDKTKTLLRLHNNTTSTLAKDLAQRENAVLLVQDEFLDHLFPGEITDIPGFIKHSSRLRNALGPHVCDLLAKGISVVLDFPANTKAQRAWFRELFERANAEHELHFVDASDALCKRQLKERSKDLSPGALWTTDAEFEAITVHFQPPLENESFHVVRHERT